MAETELIDHTGRTVFRGTQKPPGGGSQPGAVRILKHAFDFSQAAALADGVPVWTPAAGDWLLNAWIESDDPGWTADGFKVPRADIGVVTAGAWANLQGFARGFFALQTHAVDLTAATWTVDTDFATYTSNNEPTDLVQSSLISAGGTGFYPPQARWRTAAPLSLVVSDDGNPGGDAFDGSAGASTLYLAVVTPGTTP